MGDIGWPPGGNVQRQTTAAGCPSDQTVAPAKRSPFDASGSHHLNLRTLSLAPDTCKSLMAGASCASSLAVGASDDARLMQGSLAQKCDMPHALIAQPGQHRTTCRPLLLDGQVSTQQRGLRECADTAAASSQFRAVTPNKRSYPLQGPVRRPAFRETPRSLGFHSGWKPMLRYQRRYCIREDGRHLHPGGPCF